jgi:hypothetical protein
MKIESLHKQHGSVLIMTLLTITILSLICATTLYIGTQNTAAGMHAAGWQEALTTAESGMAVATRALNKNSWTNWRTVSTALPTPCAASPTPCAVSGYTYEPATGASTGSAASAAPSSSQYNYLPSSISSLQLSFPNSEGPTSASYWATIDTAGMSGTGSWYRVRSTGQISFPTNAVTASRLSNNRLDDDLRNTITTRLYASVNRKGGSFIGATRTVESVVYKPNSWGGVLLQNALTMSGGGIVDSFNSGTYSTSAFLAAQTGSNPPANPDRDTSYASQSPVVGMLNSSGSNLNATYVYGNLSYAGTAPSNTSHVQGTISSGFSTSVPTVSDPSWSAGTYLSYSGGGNPPFTDTTGFTNSRIKISGNFNTSGSQSVHIAAKTDGAGNPIATHYDIWVTGDYTTSGSSYITQDALVSTTWYIDGNITSSGGSYINGANTASNVSFIGVNPTNANNKQFTISGSAAFIGTITAPSYAGTISGSGYLVGAIWANTLNLSGGSGVHFDEALNGANGSTYSYKSWFEDNSDPVRGITY